MSKAIGIDLGTTNSAVGLKRLDTDILPNAEGDLLTPSVVGYREAKGLLKSAEMIVGKHALEWMAQGPASTAVSVKRLMGRSFEDEDVQRLLQGHRYACRVKPLPFKTESFFRLMRLEQRLAHFRVYNLVNEEREFIGELWLSFDPGEDNLIIVGASLKDRSDVRVSRTPSRGNADERLFLELESAIARVNDEEHEYFTKYDFLFRSGAIAGAIRSSWGIERRGQGGAAHLQRCAQVRFSRRAGA